MALRILMVRTISCCLTYVILITTVLNCIPDKETETEEQDLLPPSGDVDVHNECKGIGVVLDETCKSAVPSVADPIMASEGGVEEKAIQSPDAEESVTADSKFAQEEEEEEDIKKDVDDKVGALIGALCSFGVAAATACVFLIGGRLHHQHTQQHKIQLQFFGDDKVGCMTHSAQNNPSVISLFPGGFFDLVINWIGYRYNCLGFLICMQRIQQVVRQTSRLNQKAMSFAMGAGASRHFGRPRVKRSKKH
jgi:hypothetical protein